jgi:hypothetical protein
MQKEVKKLNVHVDKSQEKMYLRVPFDVPDNVEVMKISYTFADAGKSSIPFEGKTIIDLALIDNEGVLVGATGSSWLSIEISASGSSPGYDRREIKKGVWTIILGAYLVPPEGADVEYTIEFIFKQFRYLRGDLHMHTVNSDGKHTLDYLLKNAQKSKYDFVATTEHNNFFNNKRLPVRRGLTIIPGVELTNYMGHMNFWGVETPYSRPYDVGSFDEFKALSQEAKKNGAVISVNHPFCSVCPWRWDLENVQYDTIEVWNGPMRLDNLKTINWWHQKLLEGKKIAVVGGSDFHKNYYGVKIWGLPMTLLYARSNSVPDLLDAIKRGRAVITANPKAAYIDMRCGNYVVGETVKFKEGVKVEINISPLKRGQTVVVLNNDQVIYNFTAKSKAPHTAIVPVESRGFVRVEVRYRPKLWEKIFNFVFYKFIVKTTPQKELPDFIYCLTNPIYFD